MVESTGSNWNLLPDEELKKIKPYVEETAKAVNSIRPIGIVEFKGYAQPPEHFQLIGNAFLIMFGEKDKKKINWPAAQRMFDPPGKFCERL